VVERALDKLEVKGSNPYSGFILHSNLDGACFLRVPGKTLGRINKEREREYDGNGLMDQIGLNCEFQNHVFFGFA